MARRVSRFAGLAAVHLTATAAVGAMALAPAGAEESLQLEVTASVANVCDIGIADGAAEGLDFGALVPGNEGVASTTLRVSCTFQSTPKVIIGDGGHFDMGTGRRLQREGGSDFLPYSVCENNPTGNNCSPWDNNQSHVPVGAGAGNGTDVGVHAYITSTDTGGLTQEGTFSDTLEVTVEL